MVTIFLENILETENIQYFFLTDFLTYLTVFEIFS